MDEESSPSTIDAAPVLVGRTLPVRRGDRFATRLLMQAPVRQAVISAGLALTLELGRTLLQGWTRRRAAQRDDAQIHISVIQIEAWFSSGRDR